VGGLGGSALQHDDDRPGPRSPRTHVRGGSAPGRAPRKPSTGLNRPLAGRLVIDGSFELPEPGGVVVIGATIPNVTRFVSAILGVVIGLTFLFGFGNMLTLALGLGARNEDAEHRQRHQRPISAEALRKRLRIGAQASRVLVAAVRVEYTAAS
jgi:hypothetical protein